MAVDNYPWKLARGLGLAAPPPQQGLDALLSSVLNGSSLTGSSVTDTATFTPGFRQISDRDPASETPVQWLDRRVKEISVKF